MNNEKKDYKPNTPVFKLANNQVVFHIEYMEGDKEENGKIKHYEKIVLCMVQTDENNKAVCTVRFYMDIPFAKVIFQDMGRLQKINESGHKKTQGFEKNCTIKTNIEGEKISYRVSIYNNDYKKMKEQNKKDGDSCYFVCSKMQARQLSITVLDFLRNYELSTAIVDKIKQENFSTLIAETCNNVNLMLKVGAQKLNQHSKQESIRNYESEKRKRKIDNTEVFDKIRIPNDSEEWFLEPIFNKSKTTWKDLASNCKLPGDKTGKDFLLKLYTYSKKNNKRLLEKISKDCLCSLFIEIETDSGKQHYLSSEVLKNPEYFSVTKLQVTEAIEYRERNLEKYYLETSS